MRDLQKDEKPKVMGGTHAGPAQLNPGIRWPPRIPGFPPVPGQPPKRYFEPGDGGS